VAGTNVPRKPTWFNTGDFDDYCSPANDGDIVTWVATANRFQPKAPASYPVSVVVSPTGLATGGSTFNSGAAYGPDTPGTTTCGIQEAINSLRSITFISAGNVSTNGKSGSIQLLGGVFNIGSGHVVIPAGDITIEGQGASTYVPFDTFASPISDYGGTAIVGTDQTHSVVATTADGNGNPATKLTMRGLDIRMQSPVSQQNNSAPPILDLRNHQEGIIEDVTVVEVASGGGIGTKMYTVIDLRAGANKSKTLYRNIHAVGGHTGMWFAQAHCMAVNCFAGGNGNGADAFDSGFNIQQNTDNWFGNLHTFSADYGLLWNSYGNFWGGALIIHGIHFETVAHYVLANSGASGVLILDNPLWDTGNPTPQSDTYTAGSPTSSVTISSASGQVVLSRDEIDAGSYGAGRHVTPPKASITAGSSPYSYGPYPFDAVLVVTTAGSASAVTLGGQSIGSSLSSNQVIYLPRGNILQVTWATTAPVLEVVPT
jgi:hypothetical protein